MPVRVLLQTMSSRELSEWRAYERFYGPVDRSYDSEMLAQIHELLQVLIQVTVRVNGGEGWEPKPVPRPWWTPPVAEETEEQYQTRLARDLKMFDAELSREG